MTTAHDLMRDWQRAGFAFPPQEIRVPQRIRLYRVWGGGSLETGAPSAPGVFLSFDAPQTRREAEGLFAVWEYGNDCRFLTVFEISAGATIFVGKVHPGDYCQSALGVTGSQVFLATTQMRRFARKIGIAKELVNDMGRYVVVPNKDPGKHRSS